MSKERKTQEKLLKEMSPKEFQEMFIEWYLPALRSVAYRVKKLGDKMDEIIEKLSIPVIKEKK